MNKMTQKRAMQYARNDATGPVRFEHGHRWKASEHEVYLIIFSYRDSYHKERVYRWIIFSDEKYKAGGFIGP